MILNRDAGTEALSICQGTPAICMVCIFCPVCSVCSVCSVLTGPCPLRLGGLRRPELAALLKIAPGLRRPEPAALLKIAPGLRRPEPAALLKIAPGLHSDPDPYPKPNLDPDPEGDPDPDLNPDPGCLRSRLDLQPLKLDLKLLKLLKRRRLWAAHVRYRVEQRRRLWAPQALGGAR